MTKQAIFETQIKDLPLVSRGKVRDIYECGDYLLIVTSDRISAFDVIMPNPIPEKGKILNRMSAFWFEQMNDIIPNHIVSTEPSEYPSLCHKYKDLLTDRSMLVKRAKPLPVECIIRGYLSGSGWNDYQNSGVVSGIKLPVGLRESASLPEPLFTPSTKADIGEHDVAITFVDVENLLGTSLAARIKEISLAIYERAAKNAIRNGIIIADTKMEFGIFGDELIIIDELLTPDSSRFWPLDEYEEGRPQKSFDKQFLRDYLLASGWDKKPPAPELPSTIINKTSEKYQEAYQRIVKKR